MPHFSPSDFRHILSFYPTGRRFRRTANLPNQLSVRIFKADYHTVLVRFNARSIRDLKNVQNLICFLTLHRKHKTCSGHSVNRNGFDTMFL